MAKPSDTLKARKPGKPRELSDSYAGTHDLDISLRMDPQAPPHGPLDAEQVAALPASKKTARNKKAVESKTDLKAAIFQDAVAEEQLENVAIPATNEDLIKAAEEMADLKREIDQLEAEAKQRKDRYDQLRKVVLPEAMKRLNMLNSKGKGSFTFSGGKIHLEQKLYAACTRENEPLLFEFLRVNGDEGLIRETVNSQTLSAYIRERRGEGLNDPPGVSVHEEVTAKLTRST
jgi:hypothetical protein